MEESNDFQVTHPKYPETTSPADTVKKLIKNRRIQVLFLIVTLIAVGTTSFLIFTVNNSKLTQLKKDTYGNLFYGNYEAAQETAQKGLSLSPNDKILLGEALDANASLANQTGTEKETFEKSMDLIKKAEIAGKDDASLQLSIGYIHEIAEKYKEALTYYDRALQLDPNSSVAYFHKGHALAFLGNTKEAIDMYTKSYQLDSSNPLTLLALGNNAYINGDFDKAYGFYKLVADGKNYNVDLRTEAYMDISTLYRAAGNAKGALTATTSMLTLNSNYSRGYGEHGINLILNGKSQEGAELLAKAIKINPRIGWNYWAVGSVLKSGENYVKAIEFYTQAIEKIENDNTLVSTVAKQAAKANWNYDLAISYYLSGSSARAIQILNTAFSYDNSLKRKLKNDIANVANLKKMGSDLQVQQLLKS